MLTHTYITSKKINAKKQSTNLKLKNQYKFSNVQFHKYKNQSKNTSKYKLQINMQKK